MKCLSLLLFIFISFCSLGQKEISWSDNKLLTWSNFQKRAGQGSFFKAQSYTGIRYEVETVHSEVQINVACYFIPKESWVFKKFMASDLLKHEQGHFDITEIYARKMRVKFLHFEGDVQRFISKKSIDNVKEIYDSLYEELEATQDEYDKETDHGLNREAQVNWFIWISDQLESLSEWSIP